MSEQPIDKRKDLQGAVVVITAGGTGGHVFPALAVASEVRDRGGQVHWLGTDKGIEASAVPREGFELHRVKVGGLRGKGLRVKMKGLLMVFSATAQAMMHLKRLKPIGVLGMGGYVTGPVGVAAWLLRIPLAVHEQNAIAGMTNRWLSKLSRRVFAAFPGAFPASIERGVKCVGNPIRASITQLPAPEIRMHDTRESIRLLVVGGSLGAAAINDVMPETMKRLEQVAQSAQVKLDLWHQCGKQTIKATSEAYGDKQYRYKVEAFIDNMASAYEWADIIVCRAGALTVSEVAAVGVPAIFIPFPYAVDDHQTKNAQVLAEAGAAVIVPQAELTPERLENLLSPLLLDRAQRIEMATKGRQVAKRDAAVVVTEQFLEVSLLDEVVC